MRHLDLFRRLWQEQLGSELVEFAISISLTVMLLFCVMEVSRAMYVYHYVSTAARQATHHAMVRGSTWGSTVCSSSVASNCQDTAGSIRSAVTEHLPSGVQTAPLDVAVTWPGTTPTGQPCDTTNGTNSPGCIVTVRVTYHFLPELPFVPAAMLDLASTSSVMILQ